MNYASHVHAFWCILPITFATLVFFLWAVRPNSRRVSWQVLVFGAKVTSWTPDSPMRNSHVLAEHPALHLIMEKLEGLGPRHVEYSCNCRARLYNIYIFIIKSICHLYLHHNTPEKPWLNLLDFMWGPRHVDSFFLGVVITAALGAIPTVKFWKFQRSEVTSTDGASWWSPNRSQRSSSIRRWPTCWWYIIQAHLPMHIHIELETFLSQEQIDNMFFQFVCLFVSKII